MPTTAPSVDISGLPPENRVVASALISHAPTEDSMIEWAKWIVEGHQAGRDPIWSLLSKGVPQSDIERSTFRAAGFHVERINTDNIDRGALERLGIRNARDYSVIPLRGPVSERIVGVTDPLNQISYDKGCAALGVRSAAVVLVDRTNLNTELAKIEQSETFAASSEDEDDDEVIGNDLESNDNRTLQRARSMIETAYRSRASDIHVEPIETGVRVRFRIDKRSVEAARLTTSEGRRLVQAYKILAHLDMAANRITQGKGKFSLTLDDGARLDLRVASRPSAWEKQEGVVIRILDQSSTRRSLTDLGIADDHLETWRELIQLENGLILVCGPTNSGKTTTMYASLQERDAEQDVIFTAEEPIEYRYSGINQIQIEPGAGMTFPKAIEDFLRMDPDVILVGETRDADTAKMSVQAALTGHLVMSSLHANDSPSAAERLCNMGVEAFQVADTLRGVLSQRLVRRVCRSCRQTRQPTPNELRGIGWAGPGSRPIFFARPGGCASCNSTGYAGLIAVNELLVVDERIGGLIGARAKGAEVRQAAREAGMRTLIEDGILRILDGTTTIAEVTRLVSGVSAIQRRRSQSA